MKNSYIFSLLAIITLVLQYSCQSEDLDSIEIEESLTSENLNIDNFKDKGYIQNAQLDEKLAYKEFHLTNLMEQILQVSPEFADSEEFKVAKGNESYYLENLLTNNLAQEKGVSLTDKNDIPSLNAFTDLEGETWYPIIKVLRKGNKDGKKALYLINSYDEKKRKEIVKSYKLNKNGKLKLIDKNLTKKEYENQYMTGKQSLPAYQLLLTPCSIGSLDCGGGGGGGGGGTVSTTYKLKTMKIKDKKESWLEAADITIFKFFGILLSPMFFMRIYFTVLKAEKYVRLKKET